MLISAQSSVNISAGGKFTVKSQVSETPGIYGMRSFRYKVKEMK
jgi:hypothetical protein